MDTKREKPLSAQTEKVARITRADIGRTFTFHGYDGNLYRCELVEFKRRIATIKYAVFGLATEPHGRIVTAYLENLARLDRNVI